MTEQEQEQGTLIAIRQIMASKVDYRGDINPEVRLGKDLELDSVSLTVLLVALEDHFHISLDADVLAEVQTVEELVRRSAGLIGAK